MTGARDGLNKIFETRKTSLSQRLLLKIWGGAYNHRIEATAVRIPPHAPEETPHVIKMNVDSGLFCL